MSIFAVRLEPDDAEGADQPEERADLKLPLPNYEALFGKKYEGEQRGEDDGGTNENRVNAGSHVKERDDLRDLMNDVRQARNETGGDRTNIDLWTAAELKKDEGNDCETGGGVSVEVLRPGIVEAIEIELEERGNRPNGDGGKDRAVTS